MTKRGSRGPEFVPKMPVARRIRLAAEEVAPAVLFLCSDDASYITGTTLVIDGGFSAR